MKCKLPILYHTKLPILYWYNVSASRIKVEGTKKKTSLRNNKEAVKKNLAKKKCETPTEPVLLNTASSSNQPDVVIQMCVDEWFCSICEEKRIEDMIQCTKCRSWCHELCAGVQPGTQTFSCDLCK